MKTFFTFDDVSAYEEMANVERVKPANPKKFDFLYTFDEEALPSPISTNYQDSEALNYSQVLSPFSEKSSKKTDDTSFLGNNLSDDIFADDMSECEPEADEPTKKFDDRKDNMIKKLALKCKYDWKKVANKFNKTYKMTCSPTELKDRYKNLHKPNITLRIKFTPEEDKMIAQCFEKYGSDWAQIAAYFPTRTAVMVKNRYYSFVRKSDLLSNTSTGDSEDQDQDEQFTNVSIQIQEGSSNEETKGEESFQSFLSGEFNYRIKNLFEEIPEAFNNYPVFDMDTCLASELFAKITPANY